MSIVAAQPVVTRIGDELYTRLKRLEAMYTVFAPFVQVIRPTRRNQESPRHLQLWLTEGAEERVPELDCDGNPPSRAYKQIWNLRVHCMPAERDPTPVEVYSQTMKAAVVQAVTDSGNRWWTFTELAIDAEFLTSEQINNDGAICGFNLPIAITYRFDETNPYRGRS